MTKKKTKIVFYLSQDVADLLKEAGNQAKVTARKMAKVIVENWVRYYQSYALDDADISRAQAYNAKQRVSR
jgi:hypothetical protein